MVKVKITVKQRQSVDFELNGCLLRAYESGDLYRYFEHPFIGPVAYQKGWNKLADSVTNDGYVRNKIGGGKAYRRHRVIYKAFNPNWDITNPKNIIDHIDANKLNNCITNLRIATVSQNGQNRSVSKHSKSGEKDITPWNDRINDCWYWRVDIVANGENMFHKLYKAGDGEYPDPLPPVPQDIRDIRDRETKKHHGEFART